LINDIMASNKTRNLLPRTGELQVIQTNLGCASKEMKVCYRGMLNLLL
jgi:hypothetical protein